MNDERSEIKAFARKVKGMRDLQKLFFGGDRSVVPEAKKWEREVDRATAEVLAREPSLFDGGKGA